MPIYEYKCEKCGEIFEEHKGVKEKPLEYCKSCNGKVKRIFSPVGIVFKGSGFHVTDYKSDVNSKGPSNTSSRSADKATEKAAGSAPAVGGISSGGADKAPEKSTGKAAEKSADPPAGRAGKTPENSTGKPVSSDTKPSDKT